MLPFLLRSSFLLFLMFFHRPVNQPSIWLRSLRRFAIPSLVRHFGYRSLNSFFGGDNTYIFPALKRFFSSSKFFTLILQIISLTIYFDFQSISITRSEGIESPLFSCTILPIIWVLSIWCNSLVFSIPLSAAGSFCSIQISITGVTLEPSTRSFSINTSTGSCGVVYYYYYRYYHYHYYYYHHHYDHYYYCYCYKFL